MIMGLLTFPPESIRNVTRPSAEILSSTPNLAPPWSYTVLGCASSRHGRRWELEWGEWRIRGLEERELSQHCKLKLLWFVDCLPVGHPIKSVGLSSRMVYRYLTWVNGCLCLLIKSSNMHLMDEGMCGFSGRSKWVEGLERRTCLRGKDLM